MSASRRSVIGADARRESLEAGALRDLGALDRRGFLRLAGAAAAAGLLPTGCSEPAAPWAPPAGVSLSSLTPRTYAVLNAAAARIVGPRGEILIRARRVDPGRQADAFLSTVPELAGALTQALLVLEFGVPPLVASWRRFTGLEGAAQDAVLGELQSSRLELKRLLFGGVRSVALMGFYAAAESHAQIGYPLRAPDAGVPIAAAMAHDPEG